MSGLINKAKEMLSGDKHADGIHGSSMNSAEYQRTGPHGVAHEATGGEKAVTGSHGGFGLTGKSTVADNATFSGSGHMAAGSGVPDTRPHGGAQHFADGTNNTSGLSHGTSGSDNYSSGTGAYSSSSHGTGNTSSGQTHAREGGDASIVPKAIQRAVPEKLERALPDSIHDTGDHGGSSMREHGNHGTSGTSGYGSSNTGSGILGGSHNTSGPHSSDMSNRADPRVDSDRDGSRNMGATGAGYGSSGMGSSGLGSTGSGYTAPGQTHPSHHTTMTGELLDPHIERHGGQTGTGITVGSSTTSGTHSSDMMNRADPRVDSDLDGSRNMGASGYGSSTTGTSGYDSTTTGNTGYGSNTTGNSGYGSNTQSGPHSSGMMNKMDPRVDSDRDGSRGVGQSSTTSPRDALDASQVPPSQFGKHVTHGNEDLSDHARRHSVSTTSDRLKDYGSGV